MSSRPVVLLGLALPPISVRQGEALEQRHDEDGVGLEQRRRLRSYSAILSSANLVPQRHRASRKETGLHAIGNAPQAQVHGGGLNLAVVDFRARANFAVGDQFADFLRRQDSRLALGRAGCRKTNRARFLSSVFRDLARSPPHLWLGKVRKSGKSVCRGAGGGFVAQFRRANSVSGRGPTSPLP